MIFDRVNGKDNSRLMQFVCADMLIEVVHRPGQDKDTRDRIWGAGWRTADADRTRERLLCAGRNVSEVKDGAKPGTRVFTVRDGTCGVPTIVVQHLSDRKPPAVVPRSGQSC